MLERIDGKVVSDVVLGADRQVLGGIGGADVLDRLIGFASLVIWPPPPWSDELPMSFELGW